MPILHCGDFGAFSLALLHLSVVGLTGRSLVALVWIDTVVVILSDRRDTGFRQSE